jgi:hypothetical protein
VRNVFVRSPEVLDYQMRQTRDGIDVRAVAMSAVDLDDVRMRLVTALARAGLTDPQVAVQLVDALDRNPETAKVRRFIPLVPERPTTGALR